MRRLLASLLTPLVMSCVKPASVVAPVVAATPLPTQDVGQIVFRTAGVHCYETVHGLDVDAAGANCPPQAEVEAATEEVLKDAKVDRSRLLVVKGTQVLVTDQIMDVQLGLLAQGLALGDYMIVVSDNAFTQPWRSTLKHELLHAVLWHFKRDADAWHLDERFERYNNGG